MPRIQHVAEFMNTRTAPSASDDFVEQIAGHFARTPAPVLRHIEANDWPVVAAPFAVRDPGRLAIAAEPDSSALGGVLMQGRKALVYFEHNKDRLTGAIHRQVIPFAEHLHELGHVLDRDLNISQSPAFIAAHERDVARMTPEQRDQHKYFIDPDPLAAKGGKPDKTEIRQGDKVRGRQEAVAELMSEAMLKQVEPRAAGPRVPVATGFGAPIDEPSRTMLFAESAAIVRQHLEALSPAPAAARPTSPRATAARHAARTA